MVNIRKKALPFLLALTLVFGLMQAVPLTASAKAVTVKTEQALKNAVNAGGEVQLKDNIALTEMLVIPADVDVTLDLNGKKLDRGLSGIFDNGSAVRVESGASLTVIDTAGNNLGIITGGAGTNGGGICNYGTLTLKGGVIKGNRAQNGGGVYNGEGAELIIEEGVNQKKVGAQVTTSTTNVVISGNEAKGGQGGGVYNAATMKLSGAPKLSGNTRNDDVFLADRHVITFAGALKSRDRIGVWADGPNPVITSGYSKYHSDNPTAKFFASKTSAVLQLSWYINGEIILKNDKKTTVELFMNGRLTTIEKFDSPQQAWDRAKTLAAQDAYDSNSRITEFDSFSDYIVQRLGLKRDDFSNSYETGHLKNIRFVVITLGTDWKIDNWQTIDTKQNIVLDLNGHYVDRGRNFKVTDYGCLFCIGTQARFTILDSNPDAEGYDGLKGGVLTGGAGDDIGGGIIIKQSGELDMFGGTIYKCTTDYHGGAILTDKEYSKIVMSNCTIDSCRTKDSGDDCHGGGMHIRDAAYVVMNNVTIQNCYSEDKAGALYLKNKPRKVFMKDCNFIENTAPDGGGAIYIDGLNDKTPFVFIADNCRFWGNKCTDNDGGAVYVFDNDDEDRNPIIFRNCTFLYNESKRDGAALEVDDDLVTLQGGYIFENKAGRWGAVYVEDKYDISVGGKLVIKDNKAPDSSKGNLVLENADKKAYVYSGGLDEGSDIYISNSKGKTGFAAVQNISAYQTKYFHAESGSLTFVKIGKRESVMVTASLFSDGSLTAIIIISAVLILVFAAMLIFKKRKRGIADDQK